ncbi:MAG: SWIM zinc finger family protein [Nakamurella sp.]
MSGRAFAGTSVLDDSGLALALAPALTPDGIDDDPSFFHGFATHPVVVAQGLLALADITATRYFQYVPSNERDPVLTAHGDRLRAEVFSACNSVYARLDVLQSGLNGGEIGHGTTNVDINLSTRTALSKVRRSELLHLDVGTEGLRASTPTATAVERPVDMPDRWVHALGNAAEMHHSAEAVFTLDRTQARQFIAGLPNVTAKAERGWLVPDRSGARLSRREVPGGVYVNGLNRLDVLRRMMLHVTGLTVYRCSSEDSAEDLVGSRLLRRSISEGLDSRSITGSDGTPSLIEVDLPGARLTLGLTSEAWRGHSGEGSLLPKLADDHVLDDAALVSAMLSFEPHLDVAWLAEATALSADRVDGALAVLASSGRVGWDAHSRSWFHRELPDNPDRVERDNPRLKGARRLLVDGQVHRGSDGVWTVGDYRVHLHDGAATGRCTCTWYLKHGSDRGPCKHQLAARLADRGDLPDEHR